MLFIGLLVIAICVAHGPTVALGLRVGEGQKGEQRASWVKLHADAEEGAPSPVRGEFTATEWRGDILVYGGCDIRFVNWTDDTWVFPVSSNSTSPAYRLVTKGMAPPGTCGHGSVVLNDRMYVFGGNGPDGASDSLHYLDLKSHEWSEVEKSTSSVWPPPRALVQHAMTPSSKDEFVVVSGTSNDDDDDDGAFVYSTKGGQWRKISQGLAGHSNVGGSAAVMFEDKLFVMGGYAESDVLPDFLYVDTKNGQQFQPVKTTGETPGPLAFQGAVVMDQYMVLYGGFSLQTGINGDVWAWDMSKASAGTWCKVEVLSDQPHPHFAGGWVLIDDSIYAFGGRINPTGHREKLTSDLWRLDNVKSAVASCEQRIG